MNDNEEFQTNSLSSVHYIDRIVTEGQNGIRRPMKTFVDLDKLNLTMTLYTSIVGLSRFLMTL